MRRLAVAAAALVLGGCGGTHASLVVSAAASLQRPLSAYASRFGDVRYSFGGSDQLAAQIRAGFRPDVYVAADTRLPTALHSAGLVGSPTVFAGNRLVVAVPAGSQRVRSLADLSKPGVTLAIGTPTVPVGEYTRTVLARLPQAQAARIAANVRSEEPDVDGIVGKLEEGAVDAGFLYATDVLATRGRLRAVELPAALRPRVAYAAAVVAGASHAARARAFVAGLVSGAGRQALAGAGFLPP